MEQKSDLFLFRFFEGVIDLDKKETQALRLDHSRSRSTFIMSIPTTLCPQCNPDHTQSGFTPGQTVVLGRIADQISNLRDISRVVEILRNPAYFAHLTFRTPIQRRCLQDQELHRAVRSICSFYEYLRDLATRGRHRVELLEFMAQITSKLQLRIGDLEHMLLNPPSIDHHVFGVFEAHVFDVEESFCRATMRVMHVKTGEG